MVSKSAVAALVGAGSLLFLLARRQRKRRTGHHTQAAPPAGRRTPFDLASLPPGWQAGRSLLVNSLFLVTPLIAAKTKTAGQGQGAPFLVAHDLNYSQLDVLGTQAGSRGLEYAASLCPFLRGDSTSDDSKAGGCPHSGDSLHFTPVDAGIFTATCETDGYVVYLRVVPEDRLAVALAVPKGTLAVEEGLALASSVQLDGQWAQANDATARLHFMSAGLNIHATLPPWYTCTHMDDKEATFASARATPGNAVHLGRSDAVEVPSDVHITQLARGASPNAKMVGTAVVHSASSPSHLLGHRLVFHSPELGVRFTVAVGAEVAESRLSPDPMLTLHPYGRATDRNDPLQRCVATISVQNELPPSWSEESACPDPSRHGAIDESALIRDVALHFTDWDAPDAPTVKCTHFGGSVGGFFDLESDGVRSRVVVSPFRSKLFILTWECPSEIWADELPSLRRLLDSLHFSVGTAGATQAG